MWRAALSSAALAVLLSACSTAGPAAEAESSAVDLAPITVPAPGASASATAAAPHGELDIDDQAGDGTTVEVESVSVPDQAFVVITDESGSVLGWDTASPGVQIVSVRLTSPISDSAELLGILVRDDGDGVLDMTTDLTLIDDEGEPVEEDFDYRVTGIR